MSNSYLQFSQIVDELTDDEMNWLEEDLNGLSEEFLDDELVVSEFAKDHGISVDDVDCWPNFQWDINRKDRTLWVYGEEFGNVENVVNVMKRFLKEFRPNDSFSLTWSETCSKMMVDGFSGGGVFVTSKSVKWQSGNAFVYKCQQSHKKMLERTA